MYTVVFTTDDVNLPCDCKICQKVRGIYNSSGNTNLMQNRASHVAGPGRPKQLQDQKNQEIHVITIPSL